MGFVGLLRDRSTGTRVSNTELFFDLIYVVAITQLAVLLRGDPTWWGALQTLVILGMVWNAWVYTTWVTNWLDPERTPTRLMLLGVMAVSLVMTAGITQAYGERGLWVGLAYAVMQIGRSLYAVWAMRANPSLRRNYLRILSWCVLSGTLAVLGGLAEGEARLAFFAAAVLVDVIGGIVQFWTPWLGRTRTQDWTVDGPHFAERCQAFVLIALGESVIGISTPLTVAEHIGAAGVVGLVGAFVAVVALFLLYFDRWAESGVEAIARSDDPGKLAARAFHLVHPVMIVGIILLAAGNEETLAPLLGHVEAHEPGPVTLALFTAGGAAVFLLGHLVYVRMISHRTPLWHGAAIVALAAVIGAAGAFGIDGLTVGLLTAAILLLLLAGEMRRARLSATEG